MAHIVIAGGGVGFMSEAHQSKAFARRLTS
jgi:hypothetical protein